MKSIREFCTSGLSLHEREKLFEETEPISIDSVVYEAGDAWGDTRMVRVSKANQREVSMFWNALYFDNEDDADERTRQAHAEYSDYIAMADSVL